jgi:pimeloyl-ACP methyl ester carboxylesterase
MRLDLSNPAISNGLAIAGICAAAFIVFVSLVFLLIVPAVVFYYTTYRNPKKRRIRECTNKNDESQMRMFNQGVAWAEQFKDKTEELHLVNDGLNLFGEYINFGFDKCAVFLQGRAESLLYSYYFADVYAKNNHNILVIDVRAHGLSDGKYRTGGIKESDDIVLWIKLINEKYNITDFTLHGICIGGATAIYTYVKLKNEGCNFVKRIVTDGIYKTYQDLFKAFFKYYKKPSFPALNLVFFLAFILAKVRLYKESPMKYMKDIDIPVLFIWRSRDLFCNKSKSEELFEACASKHKEVCFFPRGRHAHVRSTQEAEYDKVVAYFLQKYDASLTDT